MGAQAALDSGALCIEPTCCAGDSSCACKGILDVGSEFMDPTFIIDAIPGVMCVR